MHFVQEFIFPEGVALPAGGPTNQPLVLLEVHYDNPNRSSGTQVQPLALLIIPPTWKH